MNEMKTKEELANISYNNRTVKEMQPDEQPREKMQRYGAESLSEAELLAILLRTGSRKMNVLDTSKLLLSHFGGLRNLARKNWQELKAIPGIAKVKAITLEACFELVRRVETANAGDKIIITSPESAASFFAPKLRDLMKEVFIVGFLNNAKVLMGYQKISSGGSKSTIVDPAEVIRQAILNRANSFIILHNHPSGSKNISKADIRLTKRIAKSGKTVGINLDDHIIIAGDAYVSLRQKGHLNKIS